MGNQCTICGRKKWDNLEIRVYAGTDGEFALYENENENYNYEKGLNSIISLKWNDQIHTLTIGERKGSFKGMLKSRTFNIVLVNTSNGIGVNPEVKFKKTVKYTGKQISIKL
jgi:alpha-D-xyloside xylohydrolase